MSESPVKLFGWTMPSLFLPLTSDESSSSSSNSRPPLMVNHGFVSDKLNNKSIEISSDFNKETKEVSDNNSSDQQSEITTTTSTTSEDNKTMNLKKPDKILPCPRCKSADTKFCYYNNYNVNQPRYFCRNCQRYWTAGGSMRSVPIGSGRRKNKGWASSDHHNYIHINDTKNSSKILTFGSSNSSITEDTKITSESTSPQGFLPQQVTFPVSSPWPNNQQWSSTTASFYPMPLYWACTVPFWPTQETVTNSTSLGKRTRDQTSDESIREGKDNIDDELSLGTKNHVWSPVAMRREKKERLSFFNGFDETKSSNRRLMVPENVHNLQLNPAAMARSMSFRESM